MWHQLSLLNPMNGFERFELDRWTQTRPPASPQSWQEEGTRAGSGGELLGWLVGTSWGGRSGGCFCFLMKEKWPSWLQMRVSVSVCHKETTYKNHLLWVSFPDWSACQAPRGPACTTKLLWRVNEGLPVLLLSPSSQLIPRVRDAITR